jgi:hypothetical protein
MRPLLLRPPFLVSFSVSAFSGVDFVISSNVETDMKRRPGDVGLNLRTAISGSPGHRGGCLGCEHQAMQGRRERSG